MKVIVFGATGKLGQNIARQLLKEGHTVTAFSRRPKGTGRPHPKLVSLKGDVLDPKCVRIAVAGHDAVVIALGAGKQRSSLIRSEGTLNIIDAMHKNRVRRLICQSTLGAHESRGNLNFLWKWIMFGVLLRPVLLDHEKQEQLVRASGLEWTIVRPSAFDDGPATGCYKEGFAASERGLSLKIPLADIAGFVARQLTETQYLNRAVGIST